MADGQDGHMPEHIFLDIREADMDIDYLRAFVEPARQFQ